MHSLSFCVGDHCYIYYGTGNPENVFFCHVYRWTTHVRLYELLFACYARSLSISLCGTMTTIVHDTAEAVCLCEEHNLYLKPTAKMTISVALPQLKLPGKSISNWEVMERLKAMVAPEQLSALRISKSTMDFIRFEGEVENKGLVKSLLSRLDGKSIKLSGFTDILKVCILKSRVMRLSV